ncbi:rod shape-determining protein RodA [Candidatus Saccharibacteria bacterium]|nr:rod shape-determining protein RodA [Candidatus Saccharibacteria bacterium]
MKKSSKLSFFAHYDLVLLVCTLLLTALGLTVLYSSGLRSEVTPTQLDTSRQIIYVLVGLGLLFGVSRLDYRVLRDYAPMLYGLMLVTLLFVAVFGANRLGATRWINLGFFQFQPSEFAKLFLIIFFAWFFSKYYVSLRQVRYLMFSVALLLIPLALVLAQPDLGTALVFVAIWLSMVLASKVPKRYVIALVAAALIVLPFAYQYLAPYQKQRLETFINPTANPATTGYNVNQAIIAVGSGGVWGQGLTAGSQSEGNFLPSQQTDFIFAVLSEKLGFVGAGLAILIFVVLIFRALMIARAAPDYFGSFFAVGVAAMLLFHVLINIGMNMGIMPVTGIPLPFISAGGSSMLVMLVSIGVLESIYLRRRPNLLYSDPERVSFSKV